MTLNWINWNQTNEVEIAQKMWCLLTIEFKLVSVEFCKEGRIIERKNNYCDYSKQIKQFFFCLFWLVLC